MNDEIWNPSDDPRPEDAGVASVQPRTAFTGRTPGRGSAIRAGIVLGSALVVGLGAAVALGAAPAASPSDAGAQPSAAASAAPGTERRSGRNGNGLGRGGFGLPPSALGPFVDGFGKPGAPGFGPGPFDGRDRAGGRFGAVTVTAVSGTSIGLKTDDGWTRTITVTSDTKISRGGQPATAADVKVGDTVRFAERRNSDGTFTITALAIVLPRTAGTVTSVGADTITITARDGTTQTVRTTTSTTYHLGRADGARSDVKVGTMIVAVGERGSDGTLSAASIEIVLPRVVGTVTAVSADSVTIRRLDGTTMTIHIGAGTTIDVAGVEGAKLSDVKAGMVLRADGTQRADGSLDAAAIRAGQLGKLRGNPNGPKPAPGSSTAPATGNG